MQLRQMSHSLIYTPNITETCEFLIEEIGLSPKGTPPFCGDGIWLFDEFRVPCVHILLYDKNDRLFSSLNNKVERPFYLEKNPLMIPPSVNQVSLYSSEQIKFKEKLMEQGIAFKSNYFKEFSKLQLIIQGPNNLEVEVVIDHDEI